MSQLDIDQVANNIRQTSIGCTLGMSWCASEDLKKMIGVGMNILVIDPTILPHGICIEVVKSIRNIEKVSDHKFIVAVAVDITGAHVTTGNFSEGQAYEVNLEEGARVTLTLDEKYKNNCTKDMIFIDTECFPKLIHSLRKGDRIYLDSQISLYIRDIGFDCINCIVEEGGLLGSFKRVYPPRNRLNPESVCASYKRDLKFASDIEADFVFTNFAENAAMIREVRMHLPEKTKVFAKLENQESVKNLREIIESSDGVVICRSILAMHYRQEKIFKLQKYIIGNCNVSEKPVFLSGQLVESMTSKVVATRAEASDIANAVLDGADGLILTIETARGSFPSETVDVVDNICREAERAICYDISRNELNDMRTIRGLANNSIKNVTGASAVEAADSCGASAIFIVTTTGMSAFSIAMSRPPCLVIAITIDINVARYCLAYRGLHPYLFTGEKADEWSDDIDNRINAAIGYARGMGLVKTGDRIVVVAGSLATSGSTNTMHIFTLEDEVGKLHFVASPNELVTSGQPDDSKMRRYSVMLARSRSTFGGVNDILSPV
nr:pyruvate kinase [Hymenolepis microstoma]